MYELWDTNTGNRCGSYTTREDALAAVRDDINLYGVSSKEIVSLVLMTPDGKTISGNALIRSAAIMYTTPADQSP